MNITALLSFHYSVFTVKALVFNANFKNYKHGGICDNNIIIPNKLSQLKNLMGIHCPINYIENCYLNL